MKLRIAVLSVLGMLPWAGLNAQQTATTTFRVTAKVEESCEVIARDIALGIRTMLLRATCTPNTTYHVGPNAVTGVGTGGAVDHTVFGAVPAVRVVPAGNYADFITVYIYY